MIFIGDKNQLLLNANCKTIVEFSKKTGYHAHYISAVLTKSSKCSKQFALKIAELVNSPTQLLFKETEK